MERDEIIGGAIVVGCDTTGDGCEAAGFCSES